MTNLREKLMVAKQQLLGPQGANRQQQQQLQPKRSKNSAGGRSSLSQHQLGSVGGMGMAAMMMSPRSPVQQLPQQSHTTQLLSQQVYWYLYYDFRLREYRSGKR